MSDAHAQAAFRTIKSHLLTGNPPRAEQRRAALSQLQQELDLAAAAKGGGSGGAGGAAYRIPAAVIPTRQTNTKRGAKVVMALAEDQGVFYAACVNHTLWKKSVDGGSGWTHIGAAQSVMAMTACHGMLYAVVKTGVVYVMDLYGPSPSWLAFGELFKGAKITSMTTHGSDLFAGTSNNKLLKRTALRPTAEAALGGQLQAELTREWAEVGQAIQVVCLTAADGRLYAACRNTQMWSMDLEMAGAHWTEAPPSPFQFDMGLVVTAKRFYAVDTDRLHYRDKSPDAEWVPGEALPDLTPGGSGAGAGPGSGCFAKPAQPASSIPLAPVRAENWYATEMQGFRGNPEGIQEWKPDLVADVEAKKQAYVASLQALEAWRTELAAELDKANAA